MIRAILCKLILGIDPAQIQADLRNLDAHGVATRSRLASVEDRVTDLETRMATRVTRADLTIVESDLGARLEALELDYVRSDVRAEELRASIRNTIANAVANVEAVKPVPATDITHLVQKVRAPRKPKGPQ